MESDRLTAFDQAFHTLITDRVHTFEELHASVEVLLATFEDVLLPARDWERIERFLYLHQVYGLLTPDALERIERELDATHTPTASDTIKMCVVWMHEWHSRTKDVYDTIQTMQDPRCNVRLWIELLGAIGHAGNVEELRREYEAFRARHHDDVIQAYCDCVYQGFITHLSAPDRELDMWELEVRVFELPTIFRVSANAFLAVHFRTLGELEQAWRLNVESLKIAHWYGQPHMRAGMLLDAASSDLMMGDIESAYDKLLTCRELLEESADPYVLGRTHLEEARALLALGHHTESVQSATHASRTLAALGHHDAATVSDLILVHAMFLEGQHEAAYTLLSDMLSGDIVNDTHRWLALATHILFSWHREGREAALRGLERMERDLASANTKLWHHNLGWFRHDLLHGAASHEEDQELDVTDSTRVWRPALRRLGGESGVQVDVDTLRHSLTGCLLAGLLDLQDGVRQEAERMALHTASRSFEFAEQTVSLRRRASLWAILHSLAQASPEAQSVETLFEVGWPGEEYVDPFTASRRVYWAVGELRRLGLYKVLVTMEPGYALGAMVTVAIEP